MEKKGYNCQHCGHVTNSERNLAVHVRACKDKTEEERKEWKNTRMKKAKNQKQITKFNKPDKVVAIEKIEKKEKDDSELKLMDNISDRFLNKNIIAEVHQQVIIEKYKQYFFKDIFWCPLSPARNKSNALKVIREFVHRKEIGKKI